MPRLTLEQVEALRAMPLGDAPNRLRVAIAMAGVKQNEVARAIDMAPANLNLIVAGKRYTTITLATARKIADYFGATVEDLFPHDTAKQEALAS